MIGAAYLYGGAGPDAFDCSGLVSYVHRGAGIAVPRTAAEQFRAARVVPRGELRPGDLVFFRLDSPTVSHVGIYVGNGRFVHAPQSGSVVSELRLDQPYYATRFTGSGRFWP